MSLITTDQMDMAQIMQYLQDNQLPDAGTFLQAGSVGAASLAQSSWKAIPLLGTTLAFGGGYFPPEYTVDGFGFCHMRGLFKSAAAYGIGTAFLNLPLGARPTGQELFAVQAQDSTTGYNISRFEVAVNGNITWSTAVPAVAMTGIVFASLSGITFSTTS